MKKVKKMAFGGMAARGAMGARGGMGMPTTGQPGMTKPGGAPMGGPGTGIPTPRALGQGGVGQGVAVGQTGGRPIAAPAVSGGPRVSPMPMPGIGGAGRPTVDAIPMPGVGGGPRVSPMAGGVNPMLSKPQGMAMKKGGSVNKMASGGYVKAADGCAQRGKTRGKMV